MCVRVCVRARALEVEAFDHSGRHANKAIVLIESILALRGHLSSILCLHAWHTTRACGKTWCYPGMRATRQTNAMHADQGLNHTPHLSSGKEADSLHTVFPQAHPTLRPAPFFLAPT